MQIDVREDASEVVTYDFFHFPILIRQNKLSDYPGMSCLLHWHEDIELIYLVQGHMSYNVNGEIIRMQEGNGLFVNARQLHNSFSDDDSDCVFYCIRFHPMVLCINQEIEEKYVRPVLENESIPYILLDQNNGKHYALLEAIHQITEIEQTNRTELLIQSNLYTFWNALYQMAGVEPGKGEGGQYYLTILKKMITFIQRNYRRKIALKDISAAGGIGKTSCCKLFAQYVNQTPVSYLLNYRLLKSIELLKTTDMTITEISYEVGFAGASYYTETFRKYYHCTPTDYRKTLHSL